MQERIAFRGKLIVITLTMRTFILPIAVLLNLITYFAHADNGTPGRYQLIQAQTVHFSGQGNHQEEVAVLLKIDTATSQTWLYLAEPDINKPGWLAFSP
jgi:hypothetical protein